MRDIIMLSGKMGSGKTTIMEKLRESYASHGVDVYNVIFADTIYRIHDFAIQLLKDRGIERDIVKDGKLLQLLGTEWGRTTLGEDIWVKCLLGEIKAIGDDCPQNSNIAFVVSDCRFKNEFDGIPQACKIRLEASREVRKERCSQWRENDTHQSEIDLDEYAKAGKFNIYLDTEQPREKVLERLYASLILWNSNPEVTGLGFQAISEKYYV